MTQATIQTYVPADVYEQGIIIRIIHQEVSWNLDERTQVMFLEISIKHIARNLEQQQQKKKKFMQTMLQK